VGNRRLQVFVSSRMGELAPERGAVKAALDGLEVDAKFGGGGEIRCP
jgi:hypothetical protein